MQLMKTGPDPTKILVKLSGDGTRFSSTASYVFLTFSFPDIAKDALAASGTLSRFVDIHMYIYMYVCTHARHMHVGNHTFASVRGHETFEFLRDSLAPVWNEVGELTSNPTLCVNDVQYSLQVVFGADYKVGMHVLKLADVHKSTCNSTFC